MTTLAKCADDLQPTLWQPWPFNADDLGPPPAPRTRAPDNRGLPPAHAPLRIQRTSACLAPPSPPRHPTPLCRPAHANPHHSMPLVLLSPPPLALAALPSRPPPKARCPAVCRARGRPRQRHHAGRQRPTPSVALLQGLLSRLPKTGPPARLRLHSPRLVAATPLSDPVAPGPFCATAGCSHDIPGVPPHGRHVSRHCLSPSTRCCQLCPDVCPPSHPLPAPPSGAGLSRWLEHRRRADDPHADPPDQRQSP